MEASDRSVAEVAVQVIENGSSSTPTGYGAKRILPWRLALIVGVLGVVLSVVFAGILVINVAREFGIESSRWVVEALLAVVPAATMLALFAALASAGLLGVVRRLGGRDAEVATRVP